ncbi:MAG: YdeI/OmpD-associated family protein [Myxococcota bacterium]
MVRRYQHVLCTELTTRTMGKASSRSVTYTVLYLSDALRKRLPFGRGSRLRIEGDLEGVSVALAFQPARGANHFVMVSNDLLRRIDREVGDTVTLRFNVDDPNRVVVPQELRDALAEDEDARATWAELTPGRKRSWASYVERAKRQETRRDKTEEVVDRLRRGLVDPRDRWPSVD